MPSLMQGVQRSTRSVSDAFCHTGDKNQYVVLVMLSVIHVVQKSITSVSNAFRCTGLQKSIYVVLSILSVIQG